jgi:stage V sporulation protein R
MRNFKDESFIGQYLSPKLMRDLRLFAITTTRSSPSWKWPPSTTSRLPPRARGLSQQYDLGSREPNIQVWNVNLRGDRS